MQTLFEGHYFCAMRLAAVAMAFLRRFFHKFSVISLAPLLNDGLISTLVPEIFILPPF